MNYPALSVKLAGSIPKINIKYKLRIDVKCDQKTGITQLNWYF